ncbi:hypothetical protein BSF41_47440 [Flavobacterium sp. ACN2]|jgi:hypothetical protein|uniref:ISAon1 family transposase N-terminal region protein n=1 Tax=Flavobacterium sp. ACN2 TaxID=1975676 RepID=UPI000BB3C6DB|nr:transposase [Flavobacterium sp. ACN2]PBI82607.1 hypothetical protein BSF41_47440 [Flavobacterium sp. ACN2]
MDPIELLKFMLPDFLVDHFDVVSSANTEEVLHLYFEEKSKVPEEFNTLELVSKGFQDEITIQDFPLRGKYVYLHIKRRRWTNKTTGKIIKRDWQLAAKGTRMTQEFAAFLKEINR